MNALKLTLAAGALGLTLGLPVLAHADHAPNHIHMVKTPTCGCCQVWADALKQMGLPVTVAETDDYAGMKAAGNVPEDAYACHTSRMGRYILEGHVPPDAIRKLLDEAPEIDGVGVPGMPMASLGMQYDPEASYDVLAFHDGKVLKDVFLVTGTPAAE